MEKMRFVKVEYDLKYWGGDYSGVGQMTFIPYKEGMTNMQLRKEFRKRAGHPDHIIHYSFDELYNEVNGEFVYARD